MKKQYGKEVWNATREYAVWMPGSLIALGDYGIMNEGCFERIGNVKELAAAFTPRKTRSSLDELEFHSDGVSEAQAEGGGPQNLVTVTYSTAVAAGVVFKAKGLTIQSLSNLNELGEELRNCAEWDRSWRIVTSVNSADNFFAFVGSKAGTKFSITSDLAVFPGLDAPAGGNVKSSIRFEGDCALKILGQSGPVSVQLHRRRFFGKGLKHAAPADAMSGESGLVPYIEDPFHE